MVLLAFSSVPLGGILLVFAAAAWSRLRFWIFSLGATISAIAGLRAHAEWVGDYAPLGIAGVILAALATLLFASLGACLARLIDLLMERIRGKATPVFARFLLWLTSSGALVVLIVIAMEALRRVLMSEMD